MIRETVVVAALSLTLGCPAPTAAERAAELSRSRALPELRNRLDYVRHPDRAKEGKAVDLGFTSAEAELLEGLTRGQIESALGEPSAWTCPEPCPDSVEPWAYGFFYIPAVGGGSTLVLHFDQNDTCTRAEAWSTQ